MKVRDLHELARAADIKYATSTLPMTDQEQASRQAFYRHAFENYTLAVAELERLNLEIAQYAENDNAELPQCTDARVLATLVEVDF